jgi:tRNA threonylcarbamoyl adenosine modification protein YeaZ
VLLALETATDTVSVALHDETGVVMVESVDAARRHAETLAPLVERVLREGGIGVDGITRVAVGVGPGAFTGLRVGIATARAFAYARGLPCIGVLTLDAVAEAALHDGRVPSDEPFAAVLDARRREVFWGVYRDGRLVDGPDVGAPDDVLAGPLAGLAIVGDCGTAPGALAERTLSVPASAAAVARIATADGSRFSLRDALPVYVRRPDAVEPQARKLVTPEAR